MWHLYYIKSKVVPQCHNCGTCVAPKESHHHHHCCDVIRNRADIFLKNGYHLSNQVRFHLLLKKSVPVARVRRLSSVGRGGGVNVDIGCQKTVEHGPAFAGFHVEDHLVIFLQLAHDFDGLQQLARVELPVGEGDQARGAVIGEVNEDVVFGSAAQKLERERPRDEVEICCYVISRVNKLHYSLRL